MADLSQRKNRTTQRRQSACRREKTYYLKGSNHFSKRNNHFNKRGIVPSSKKNNRSVIEKQLPHHRKRAASPPKNSCLTTEKQTYNRWQTDIASMANHHLNEEKPSTKVSQSLLLGDNFLSPERKKFFTYTTQSETIEKGINTSPIQYPRVAGCNCAIVNCLCACPHNSKRVFRNILYYIIAI